MMKNARILFSSAFVLLLALGSRPAAAASLEVVGTGDGMDILQALAKSFGGDNAGIIISIPPSIGSGGAVTAVGTDKQVLGRVARPLSEAEKGQGLVYAPFMRIPSAIIAHPSAGVASLTNAQLRAIFDGTATNWKDVGGADLRIRVVRREDADSTLGILRASMPGWKDLQITTRSKTAATTQEMFDTVRATEGAIGWAPYSSSLGQTMRVISIDGKAPTAAGYPSAVEIALIYKEAKVTPEARKFIDYVKSAKAKTIFTGLGAVGN